MFNKNQSALEIDLKEDNTETKIRTLKRHNGKIVRIKDSSNQKNNYLDGRLKTNPLSNEWYTLQIHQGERKTELQMHYESLESITVLDLSPC